MSNDQVNLEVIPVSKEERAYQQYRECKFDMAQLVKISPHAKSTLYDWKRRFNWDARRAIDEMGGNAVQDTINWLIDPKTSLDDVDKNNVEELKKCLSLVIANIKKDLLQGEHTDVREMDKLLKISSTIEKLTGTKIKEKDKGVSKHAVLKYDMVELVRLRLEHYRKTGKQLSEKEVMELANPDNYADE